ncbi:MAG: phospholipid carrier-dependent glycosyltransferase [Arachnia sp.]
MTTLEALRDGRLRDQTVGWVVTLAITAMAFGLRLYNVGFPQKVLFDETYYAKDAWAILQSGYERNWSDSANDLLAKGDTSGMLDTASFVVHPPLGKLLIGLGEHLFGMNAFGWRISAVVFGTLLVFFTIRLGRRLSRSTLIGAMAGLFLTFDGLAFVMSRLALLDIFQATFAVAAVAALVADRDWFRERLARYLERHDLPDLGGRFGPLLLWRPWRVVAGLLLGASCAVKWNSMFVIAAFGVLAVIWDLGARRLAGAGRNQFWSLLIDAPGAFVQLVVVAVPVYLASWWNWLATDGGYYRDFGEKHPDDPLVRALGTAFGSLAKYHLEAYNFHTGDGMMKDATHPYEAHPAGWLLMLRPTGIEAVNDIQPGVDGCRAVTGTCLRVITTMGTPLLWWGALAAIVLALGWWIVGRDWRFGVPLIGIASTWIPWFRFADRPLFFFYTIMIIPFSCIVLAMALGKLLGPAHHPERRFRSMIVGIVVAVVIFNFAFIYPILTAEVLPRAEWMWRMWLGNAWI